MNETKLYNDKHTTTPGVVGSSGNPIIAQMCPTPYNSRVHVGENNDHTWESLYF
jgi:hypothetical protein